MIEIRVLINDLGEGVKIQITSGTSIVVEDYFMKKKDMDLPAYLRQRTRNSFDHALEIALDKINIKELEL